MSRSTGQSKTSRRAFLKTGTQLTAASAAAAGVLGTPSLGLARSAHPAGSDTVRIGLVGCGGRGTNAAQQAMNTESNVQLVAVGDAFQNRVDQCVANIKETHQGKVNVSDDNKHVGLDAYQKVIESDIDMVLLVTPPGFRPLHFETAIDAGKHVFMEKPVAVDAPGVRRILAANEKAKQKGLAVAVGLQRRHERAYMETIDKLQDGIIGDLVFSRAYWNGTTPWKRARTADQTELEYQMTNWYYFNWICGDHIVEQHIHNLDVINWLLGEFPISAQGQGGRLIRTGRDTGQIYDHHMVEFTYANGHKMLSQCRHMDDCWNSVSEHVHGTQGYADIHRGRIFGSNGDQLFQSRGSRGGWQQEHHDLFADLRNGVIPNEGEYGAKSTMTAILGRLATYTGKYLKWDDAINSSISLCDVDAIKSMSDPAPIQPDENGHYPIALPGITNDRIIDF